MGLFTRDEEELLTYDADAFFYFAGTILLVTFVPWTFFLLRRIIWPRPPRDADFERAEQAPQDTVMRLCATSAMEAKRREVREATQSWRRRLGPWNQLQLLVVLLGWMCFGICISRLKPITFDPHHTLGLTAGASVQQIKKAYRQLSLQHHPDKDRDNPLAPVIFQKITKAYRTLTDEKARKNYERYGNPDGPVGMKVGIALHPVILFSKETQLKTLCIFFSILFVVPLSIVCCCLRGSKMSAGGVAGETLRTLHACIDSEVRAEDGPGLLAASAEAQWLGGVDLRLAKALLEFRPQPMEVGVIVEVVDGGAYQGRRGTLRSCEPGAGRCEVELWPQPPQPGESQGQSEVQTFARVALTPAEPQIVCPFSDPPIRRTAALVWAHMWRLHHHMSPLVRARVDALLRLSTRVLRAGVSIAAHGQPGSSHFEVVSGLVHFQRALVQALDLGASPWLQLPHVGAAPKGAPELREVVEAGGFSPAMLKELKLNDAQRLDIEAFCRHAPRVKLSCQVGVSDEKDIAEGDFATLTVTLTRLNLDENEAAGPVHAPLFPCPKYEEWWILVYDERSRRLVTADVITGTGREESCKVHFIVSRPGKHRWTVHALCDSYAGLDASCEAHFETLRKKDVSREIFVHPEDAQIRTLFEELMEGLNPEDPDEDSSDDEKDSATAKPLDTATGVVAAAASKDSDDESEGEMGTECLFYKASGDGGLYLYRCPENDPQHRLGSVPKGTVLRGVADGAPEGWAQLCYGGGAWIRVGNGETASGGQQEIGNTPARCVGSLSEQDLRSMVQSRSPLSLVRRWLKCTEAKFEPEDLRSIEEIEDSRVRMMIEEMLRDKIGDETFELLLDRAQALAQKHRKRLGRALGFFSSQNGIIWHVSPQGHVHGLYPDGSRLLDRVELTDDDQLQIGPFRLDETRTCSCIHWMKLDDQTKSWVWARDITLRTRVRLGLAF